MSVDVVAIAPQLLVSSFGLQYTENTSEGKKRKKHGLLCQALPQRRKHVQDKLPHCEKECLELNDCHIVRKKSVMDES